jgi:hypothetical protein
MFENPTKRLDIVEETERWKRKKKTGPIPQMHASQIRHNEDFGEPWDTRYDFRSFNPHGAVLSSIHPFIVHIQTTNGKRLPALVYGGANFRLER